LSELKNAPTAEINQKGAALWNQGAQLGSQEFAALRKLPPPPGDAAVLQSSFDAAQQSIDLLNQISSAIRDLDASMVETLSGQLDASSAKARGIAQGYGFKVCGSD
jgi:hypothetical protein